ncbi:hypothetical protein ACOMHN_015444 [Nucella lapillus]
MAVWCDEGVFAVAADVYLHETEKFKDLLLCLGPFHWTRILLRCQGKLLRGSGLDDALVECGVFGRGVIESALNGTHYVRALTGMLIVEDLIRSLQWQMFWQHKDQTAYPELEQVQALQTSLAANTRCPDEFETLTGQVEKLHQDFVEFEKECEAKSELCQFFGVWLRMVAVIKNAVVSDREGNWDLYVATVEDSMPIFAEFNCTNYQRYGSWYLEQIKVLEFTHPELYRRFSMGLWVVKDRPGWFCAVGGDMKVEQTIQRVSKGPEAAYCIKGIALCSPITLPAYFVVLVLAVGVCGLGCVGRRVSGGVLVGVSGAALLAALVLTLTHDCEQVVTVGFNLNDCHAPNDAVSTCDNLIGSHFYRVVMAVFADLATAGNLVSLAMRARAPQSAQGSGYGVFVTHLCVSDGPMGVYLVVVGVADRLYHSTYLWQEGQWRNSVTCQLAGLTALLSNEMSAFIITLITLDRFLVIRFPFSSVHFHRRFAQLACGGQSGICLPLPLSRTPSVGHSYAFALLIVLNMILFLTIAAGQTAIYLAVRANSMKSVDSSRKQQDLNIARRLITVAVTDFLWWFPVGLMGVLATMGTQFPPEVNVAMATVVMPINSAVNPFLYTMNVVLEKRRLRREEAALKYLTQKLQEE